MLVIPSKAMYQHASWCCPLPVDHHSMQRIGPRVTSTISWQERRSDMKIQIPYSPRKSVVVPVGSTHPRASYAKYRSSRCRDVPLGAMAHGGLRVGGLRARASSSSRDKRECGAPPCAPMSILRIRLSDEFKFLSVHTGRLRASDSKNQRILQVYYINFDYPSRDPISLPSSRSEDDSDRPLVW